MSDDVQLLAAQLLKIDRRFSLKDLCLRYVVVESCAGSISSNSRLSHTRHICVIICPITIA